jgi:serine/threonine protein kinase
MRNEDTSPTGETLVLPGADTARKPAQEVAMRPPSTEVPRQLAEHPRYRSVKQLGAGGMGVVCLAEHRLMERTVALKVVNPRLRL